MSHPNWNNALSSEYLLYSDLGIFTYPSDAEMLLYANEFAHDFATLALEVGIGTCFSIKISTTISLQTAATERLTVQANK